MDLKLKIRIVLLMAKFESLTQVLRQLSNEGFKNLPTKETISNVYTKFCEFGIVSDMPRSGRPKISDEESTNPIKEILQNNPKSTLKEISALTGIKKTTVYNRIHSEINMRSFKIQFVQQLFDDDYDRRVEMAETLLYQSC